MTLTVVDASVLTAFYATDDPRRADVVRRLSAGDALFAPAHLDAEVTAALRGIARRVPALEASVPAALHHLARLAVRRVPLAPLLQRMWELRQNITSYDAAYVALAEEIGGVLLTCDAKLGRARDVGCRVEVIG